MWKGPEEFFTYTKNQRNAIVLLLGLVIAFFAVYRFWNFKYSEVALNAEEFEDFVLEWETQQLLDKKEAFANSLFYFDPNTASASDFKKLGLQTFQIRRVRKFIAKGGSFHHARDLLKIYGIDSNWVFAVEDYVKIKFTDENKDLLGSIKLKPFNPNTVSLDSMMVMGFTKSQARGVITFREKVHSFKNFSELFKVYSLDSQFVNSLEPYVDFPDQIVDAKDGIKKRINLNLADSMDMKKLKGIPNYFSKRILKYRNSLGGFYEMEQLREVYGCDSLKYQILQDQFFVDQGILRKLNVNTASLKEILQHPYLNYNQVLSIINFREKVRLFESIEEVNQLELINDSLFTKIANYLEVGKNNLNSKD